MTRFVARRDVFLEVCEKLGLIEKGFGGKDFSKLTKKQITDKNGHRKTVWVRNTEEPGENNARLKTDKEKVKFEEEIKSVLSSSVVPEPKSVAFTKENFDKYFKNGVDTPIGKVKVGEHQFDKLEQKNRKDLIPFMYETLKSPAIIGNTESGAKLYVKSFRSANEKQRNVVSVVVDKNGMHISISTHQERENQIAKKITGILYKNSGYNGAKTPYDGTVQNNSVAETSSSRNRSSSSIPQQDGKSTSAAERYAVGTEIEFQYGGNMLSGEVISRGQKGVQVRDRGGNVYKVDWDKINGTYNSAKQYYPKYTDKPTADKKQIPANVFSAYEYQKYSKDSKYSPDKSGVENALKRAMESVPDIKEEGVGRFMAQVAETNRKAYAMPETVSKYRIKGEGVDAVYTSARQKLHEKIINTVLSKEAIDKALPKHGEKPYFIILGGRGGSGKSTFEKSKNPESGVYDKTECITVDPDALKEMLADESGDGWEGYKARAYHEESSDLSKMLMKRAMSLGLNVVMDITMSNADKQIKELQVAKDAGYKTGAYYMHVPVQESFSRAMRRYMISGDDKNDRNAHDFKGRFVPPLVLLGMTDNEANFDKVRQYADDWAMYDNFVPFKDAAGNKVNAKKIAKKGEN